MLLYLYLVCCVFPRLTTDAGNRNQHNHSRKRISSRDPDHRGSLLHGARRGVLRPSMKMLRQYDVARVIGSYLFPLKSYGPRRKTPKITLFDCGVFRYRVSIFLLQNTKKNPLVQLRNVIRLGPSVFTLEDRTEQSRQITSS